MEQKNSISFLGTGTSQGVPIITCTCEVCQSKNSKNQRLRSSALFNVDDKNLLIDAGPDFRQQMLRENIQSLRAILLTHEHADHVLGLDDIRAFNYKQRKPLDIYCEKRIRTAIERIFHYVFEKKRYPGIPKMNLIEIDENPFYIDNIKITPIRCYHHKLPVLGFRINNVVYITDANRIADEEMLKIENCEILVINALRFEPHLSHFNVEQAVEIAQKVNAQKTYLTHISHTLGLHEKVEQQLPPNVHLAYDGLQLFF